MDRNSPGPMKRRDEAEGEVIRALEERGDLRHLYGRPLDLQGDVEYLANKTLKAQGFSHPLLERAKELDGPRREAEMVLERLSRRRSWLADARSRTTAQQVFAFNEQRRDVLDRYRQKLEALNRAIRDYNLGAPDALQQRPVALDRAVNEAAAQVLPLDVPEPPTPSSPWFRKRLFNRGRRTE